MSSFVRAGAFRIATGLAVTFFGIGGAVLLSGSAGPAAAVSSAPSFNHYLCYTATAKKGFKIPKGTELVPVTSTAAITPKYGAAKLHCNPVLKIVPGAQYPIVDQTWHYLCFKITASQASMTLTMDNQFGTAQLVTKDPNIFCVPSWKSLTGPPGQQPTTPPGADHYTCYPVSYASSSQDYAPPSPITLEDEFGSTTGVKVGAPQELCVPTEKILPTGLSYPVNNPSLYYVCFAVSKTPIKSPVYDENQFGTGTVTIKKTKWLCLPSSPPGTTS